MIQGYNPKENRLVPSVNLRDKRCSEWLSVANEWEWMLNFAVMLIAPQFHQECSSAISILKARQEALQSPHVANVKQWPSVFSGISLITNRETPSHLDNKGYDPAFDALLTGGTYTEAWLTMEDIGGQFLYNPGTCVLMNGKVFKHGVDDWDRGDRVCYAHFVRDDVHSIVGCERAPWLKLSDFTQYMNSYFAENLSRSAIPVLQQRD